MALPRYDPSAVQWRAIIARFGMLLPPWLLILGALFVVVHARQDRALDQLLTDNGLLAPRDEVAAGPGSSSEEDPNAVGADTSARDAFLLKRCRELHGDLLWLFLVIGGGLTVAAWIVARFAAQRDASSRRAFHAERLAAIGEAMTALAHESRNAIQRGQASIEMLAKRVRDVPDAEKHLGRLQDAQEDLHQLYERVRSYAAPVPLNRRSVDVASVMRDAFSDLDPEQDPRNIEFDLQVHAHNTHADMDPFALRRAFNNVLENALSPENDTEFDGENSRKRVLIRVEINDTRLHGAPALEVSVQDNGPGITGAVAKRIFEPFFTTRSRGTGLGMAITRRIMEMHGGQFDLVSNHESNPDPRRSDDDANGAHFVFRFPISGPAGTITGTSTDSTGPASSPAKLP